MVWFIIVGGESTPQNLWRQPMSQKDSKEYLAAVLATSLCSDPKLLVGINKHLGQIMIDVVTDSEVAEVWKDDIDWLHAVIDATADQTEEVLYRSCHTSSTETTT